MITNIKYLLNEKISLRGLWIASIVTFIISKLIQIQWLDESYANSKFPVPFYEGQTTFNAAETKQHFQVLIDSNTLDIFWNTQQIDFIYILATFIFTATVMAAIYKTLAFSERWQKFSWMMIFVMPLNAGIDVLENMVSFVMLSNPSDFSDWLIIPYSSFATAKFIFYLVGYIWIVAALCIKLLHSYKTSRAIKSCVVFETTK